LNEDPSNRRRFKWRRWNNILHRDIGYFCVALTVIYAISGVAVNHIHDWNPNYKIEKVEERFEPFPVSDKPTMVAHLVKVLELPPPDETFRPAPETVQLFYDGWSVMAHALEGKAIVEKPRDRFLLRDANYLHLNHARGLWTWFADAYAVLLLLLAVTGMFVLKGKKGLSGRGKWFVAAGLVLPVVFLIVLRYLP
jgi:hypothetical protein